MAVNKMTGVVIPRTTTMTSLSASLPTVLAAELDTRYRDHLMGGLRKRGYIVLEARDSGEALDRIRIHSRHIHVLLVNGDPGGRDLAATLKPYRPDMEIMFVSTNESAADPDVLSPDL